MSSIAALSARLCWESCQEHCAWTACTHTEMVPEMNPAKRLKTRTAPFYQPAADKQGHDSPLVKKMKVK